MEKAYTNLLGKKSQTSVAKIQSHTHTEKQKYITKYNDTLECISITTSLRKSPVKASG